MKIIGSDFHPSFQQITMLDKGTGEVSKKRLWHASGETAEFVGPSKEKRCEWGSESAVRGGSYAE